MHLLNNTQTRSDNECNMDKCLKNGPLVAFLMINNRFYALMYNLIRRQVQRAFAQDGKTQQFYIKKS